MKVDRGYETDRRVTGASSPQPRSGAGKSKRHVWIGLFALVTAIGLVISGILPRIHARAALKKETQSLAVPVVLVVHPKRTTSAQEVVLPANVQAYADAPIYARTSGYLRRWYVDIGTHVKAGQLLAEIDTPEVDQQLRQARADLATAQANVNLAKITAERFAALSKADAISRQEADNAGGDYNAKQAIVQSAEANVKRLEQLQSFEKIYAPFDGVITARNTDIGALIDSGSSGGQRTELFHISQPGRLRVYVNVPEAYARAVKPGQLADLLVPEFPGRRFQGKLVRSADAIDPATRTLLAEIDVPNPTGKLLSGAYAEVHFKFAGPAAIFTLPVDTLIFRSEGLQVATVDQNQRVALKPITLGRDFGTEVEVVAGLNGEEAIITNPPDSLVSGEQVRVTEAAGPAAPAVND